MGGAEDLRGTTQTHGASLNRLEAVAEGDGLAALGADRQPAAVIDDAAPDTPGMTSGAEDDAGHEPALL